MARHLILPLALVAVGLQAAPAVAQEFPVRASHNGAFERAYPEASALLDAVMAGRTLVLERLAADASGAGLETEVHDQLAEQARRGRARSVDAQTFARLAPEAREILARGHALQRQLLDIYADDRVTDKFGAVDQVLAAYQRSPGVSLPGEPKSFDVVYTATGKPLMEMDGHAGHAMGTMVMDHEMGFQNLFPKANGLLWSMHWIENGLFEPLIRYQTPQERQAGIAEAVARFRAMLEGAPSNYPTEMPTTAAIAPELTMYHPEAAYILNGVHLLEDVIADLLTNQHVADKQAAIRQTASAFADPGHLAITDYDWLLESLRPGIFYQGGPAIGSMDRSERNVGTPHTRHLNPTGRNAVMPGMSGGSSGSGARPSGQAPAGVDHSNH